MHVATYLKDKQRKIESKYHQVTKQFESKYELIHTKITSRFHREVNETKFIRLSINKLIKKPIVSNERKKPQKGKHLITPKTSTRKVVNSYQENIDWTRGRFSGQTIQIIVRDGKISEKVFLTPKGNRITVKRSELGLMLR